MVGLALIVTMFCPQALHGEKGWAAVGPQLAKRVRIAVLRGILDGSFGMTAQAGLHYANAAALIRAARATVAQAGITEEEHEQSELVLGQRFFDGVRCLALEEKAMGVHEGGVHYSDVRTDAKELLSSIGDRMQTAKELQERSNQPADYCTLRLQMGRASMILALTLKVEADEMPPDPTPERLQAYRNAANEYSTASACVAKGTPMQVKASWLCALVTLMGGGSKLSLVKQYVEWAEDSTRAAAKLHNDVETCAVRAQVLEMMSLIAQQRLDNDAVTPHFGMAMVANSVSDEQALADLKAQYGETVFLTERLTELHNTNTKKMGGPPVAQPPE